jgi:hypothetical protein
MIALLAPLLGTALSTLTGSLNQAYKDRLNAKNDAERIEADKQIAFFQGQINLATVAAQNDKWWSTRELIGKCALIYVFKIVVFDTVLGLGTTPDPGPQVTGIVMLVLGFYFGGKAVMDIAGKLLGRGR